MYSENAIAKCANLLIMRQLQDVCNCEADDVCAFCYVGVYVNFLEYYYFGMESDKKLRVPHNYGKFEKAKMAIEQHSDIPICNPPCGDSSSGYILSLLACWNYSLLLSEVLSLCRRATYLIGKEGIASAFYDLAISLSLLPLESSIEVDSFHALLLRHGRSTARCFKPPHLCNF